VKVTHTHLRPVIALFPSGPSLFVPPSGGRYCSFPLRARHCSLFPPGRHCERKRSNPNILMGLFKRRVFVDRLGLRRRLQYQHCARPSCGSAMTAMTTSAACGFLPLNRVQTEPFAVMVFLMRQQEALRLQDDRH